MLHRTFFDQAPVGLIFLDHSLGCVAINGRAATLVKSTPEQLVGKPITEVLEKAFGQEASLEVEAQSRRSIESCKPAMLSLPALTSSNPGAPFSPDLDIRPIRGKDGDVLGAMLTFLGPIQDALLRDLSQKLQECETRFRAIFDHTFQFIGLLKPDGTLIEANRSALDFAGVTLSEVVDKPFWDTPWWSHSAAEQQKLKAAIALAAQGQLVRFETYPPGRDGAGACIDFSLQPFKDETGTVVLLIPEGRDITELKRAEQEHEKLTMERTAEQARTAERRRMVRERLRAIAETNHHIRNALEVIQMSARSPQHAQAVKTIDEEVRRIDWVLREILGEPAGQA